MCNFYIIILLYYRKYFNIIINNKNIYKSFTDFIPNYNTNIINRVNVDNSNINQNNIILNNEITDLKNQIKNLNKENINYLKNQIKNLNKENINLKNENKILKSEIQNLKNKNKNLNSEIQNLNNKNNILKNQNDKLENEKNNYITQINDLTDRMNKLNLSKGIQNQNVNINDIVTVLFQSIDQKVQIPMTGTKTELFVKLEERLYEEYKDYKDSNNYFTVNGRAIKRFRTLEENKINNYDKILLEIYE